MGSEASKTRKIWTEETLDLFQGEGIDIGCGNDPIFPTVECFDAPQGDANRIGEFVHKKFDFVFSAHCLEHMLDPHAAIRGWYDLLKPGGHLIVIVPDEDLYEQGSFPSVFNSDHKWTFTLSKKASWSSKSVNVMDLVQSLGGELIQAEIQDNGYDPGLQSQGADRRARYLFRLFMRSKRFFKDPKLQSALAKAFHRMGAVIDQTAIDDDRLAQIQFVVRKSLSS